MAYTKKKRNTDEQIQNNSLLREFAGGLEVPDENEEDVVEEVEVAKTEPRVPQRKEDPVKRTFASDDLIMCRSVVQGALIFKGPKSGTVYKWDAPNDITEVEYQDLRSARISKHQMLMKAYFIIEDEELLSQPEWSEVKDIYGRLYSRKDLTDIFRIDNVHEMVKEINALPEGVKAQMANIAKGLMENGKLDSITKIKAIDAALDTGLMLFVTGNT